MVRRKVTGSEARPRGGLVGNETLSLDITSRGLYTDLEGPYT